MQPADRHRETGNQHRQRVDPPQQAHVAQAHSLYYADMLAQNEYGLLGRAQRENLAVLHSETSNLQVAWQTLGQMAQWQALDRALHGYYLFFARSSWLEMGQKAFASALDSLPPGPESSLPEGDWQRLRGRLILAQGRLAFHLGQLDRATDLLVTSRAALTHSSVIVDVNSDLVQLTYQLGAIAIFQGQFDQVAEYIFDCEAYAQRSDRLELLGLPFNLRGNLAQKQGAYAEARQYLEIALRYFEQQEDTLMVATIWNNLGNVAHAQADYRHAQAYYQHAYDLFELIDFPSGKAATLTNLGAVAWRLGDHRLSKQLHKESLAIKRELNNERSIAVSVCNLADAYAALGDVVTASQYFREAVQLAQKFKAHSLLFDTLCGIAALFYQTERHDLALRLFAAILNSDHASREARDRVQELLTEQTMLPPALADVAALITETLSQLAFVER